MYRAYRHMGDVLGAYRCMGIQGGVQMYRGHTDVWGSVQMYRIYRWGCMGVQTNRGHTDVWGVQ